MNYFNRNLLAAVCICAALPCVAQKMDTRLSIHVNSVKGDNLAGQPVNLLQTDYQIGYNKLALDENGDCSVKIYAGPHLLTIEREGFNTASLSFNIEEGETEKSVELTLSEKTRDPFAITAEASHDAYTGMNSISLSWNIEPPAFFDDFESYDAFAINFGDWSGIDADYETTAALVGLYPNRGVLQYAQIINPLTVYPTWWYEYPVLRPYSGTQYAGFIRTNSGNANDDWLITPVITPGTENIFSFMAKAADQYDERFMVYVTTKTDNPTQADFVRLDQGNFESVDYKGWKRFVYDVSEYAGTPVKFAIRYVGHANRYGAFMLMIDDVYVGQKDASQAMKARRVIKSAYNSYETFNIYLDGTLAGNTDSYNYTLENVAAGNHTVGIEAVYRAEKSDITEVQVMVPEINYVKVDFNVTAKSLLEADQIAINLLNLDGEGEYRVVTSGGKGSILSLPPGKYAVNIDEGAFTVYDEEIELNADRTLDIVLTDRVEAPVNLVSTTEDNGIMVKWNRSLIFRDSFEEYEDFATGTFGGWKTIDRDNCPVYPIGLGSADNIVTFPGSGNATNPTAVPPMVFNPWMTTPAMLPTDPAIQAIDGDKTIIFFSPQMDIADKWLISPLIDINKDYIMSIKAKAYSIYPEYLEFGVSDGSDNPDDFKILAETGEMPSSEWMEYHVPLAEYEGQKIRLAVHYTSYDAFLAQVDDFIVGPESGEGDMIDYGNIVNFEIYLDGELKATTKTPEYLFTDLTPGEHTIGVLAVYLESKSEMAEITINVSGICEDLKAADSEILGIYDINGMQVSEEAKGVLLIRTTNGIQKVIRK